MTSKHEVVEYLRVRIRVPSKVFVEAAVLA
jgi:hypothetical protein